MVRTSLLTALCIILIGFGVPTVCVYFSVFYGFNFIVAGVIALLALIVAGLKYLKFSDEDVMREAEKRLKEMEKLLVEIRDLLKTAGGFE